MKKLTEVDWHNAPEGATHYNAECFCPWLKETPPSYFNSSDWVEYGSHAYEDHFNNAIKRPQVMTIKEWGGKGGVPPIGTVCEYYCSERNKWRMCAIVAYYFADVVAIDVLGRTAVFLPNGLFRPVKTSEQIAEEERLSAIHEMIALVGHCSTYADVMGVLYDAGYRKPKP